MSCGSTSSPVAPSTTASSTPPERPAIAGVPHAAASIKTIPNPSTSHWSVRSRDNIMKNPPSNRAAADPARLLVRETRLDQPLRVTWQVSPASLDRDHRQRSNTQCRRCVVRALRAHGGRYRGLSAQLDCQPSRVFGQKDGRLTGACAPPLKPAQNETGRIASGMNNSDPVGRKPEILQQALRVSAVRYDACRSHQRSSRLVPRGFRSAQEFVAVRESGTGKAR